MFKLKVDGKVWRYVFLEPDACLTFEDRERLLTETVRLDSSGKQHRSVRGEGFEGKITKGKYITFTTFGGINYEVEMETDKGKRTASILVDRAMHGFN